MNADEEKKRLFKRWQELWLAELNCEFEYDETTALMLVLLVSEERQNAVNTLLDQALNSGDGSYRP